jgi:hypothetical protein
MSGKRDLTGGERLQAGCGCGALVLLASTALLGSAGEAMCKTTMFGQSTSPDGWSMARVDMTDCGALNGFSRIVWVQPAWLPSSRWLSCRAVAFSGVTPVHVHWRDDVLVVSSAVSKDDVIAAASTCQGWRIDLQVSGP